MLKNKKKEIKIKFGERELNFQNSILISIFNFNDILENLTIKKGTLLYEYVCSFIPEIDSLDSYENELENLINNIVSLSDLHFKYELDLNLEKLITNDINLELMYNLDDVEFIFNTILEQVISKNENKIYILFYNSNILKFKTICSNNCYSFNVCSNSLLQCNFLCDRSLTFFDIKMIKEEIILNWPIGNIPSNIEDYINKYYILKKSLDTIIVNNEIELIIFVILKRINFDKLSIIYTCKINDNVKSFLTNF